MSIENITPSSENQSTPQADLSRLLVGLFKTTGVGVNLITDVILLHTPIRKLTPTPDNR